MVAADRASDVAELPPKRQRRALPLAVVSGTDAVTAARRDSVEIGEELETKLQRSARRQALALMVCSSLVSAGVLLGVFLIVKHLF